MNSRLLPAFLRRPAWLLLVGLLVGALWLTARAMHGPFRRPVPATRTTLAEGPWAHASKAGEPDVFEAHEARLLAVDEAGWPRRLPAAQTQRTDGTVLPPRLIDGNPAARTALPHEEQDPRHVAEPVAAPPAFRQPDLQPAERADNRRSPREQAFGRVLDDNLADHAQTFAAPAFDSRWSDDSAPKDLLEFRAPLEPDEPTDTPLSDQSEADLPVFPAPTETLPELGNSGAVGSSEDDQAEQGPELRGDSGGKKIGRARGVVCIARPAYSQRSRDLELIAREADMHTWRGFELAGRGAYFSARAELVAALRLLAQALDAEHQTRVHSRALAAGLTAVKEAGDFIPTGSRLEADLDLSSLIGAHRTPVLKDAPSENLTPLIALRSYFTFAQEQLATAAGQELAGSMALHGLGNLHRALARQRGGLVRAAQPKAMVFYQAALLVCPENYMASNELGVLLAHAGRHEEARIVLEHSVWVYEQPTGWYNLAVVYGRLGQTDLAWRAYHRGRGLDHAEAAKRAMSSAASGQQVQWVDPGTFAQADGGPPLAPSAPLPLWSTGWNTPPTSRAAGRHVAQSSASSRPDERR